MSKYIHEEKKVSNEYPNIFALKKFTNILGNEYVCQQIFKLIEYLNIFYALVWCQKYFCESDIETKTMFCGHHLKLRFSCK